MANHGHALCPSLTRHPTNPDPTPPLLLYPNPTPPLRMLQLMPTLLRTAMAMVCALLKIIPYRYPIPPRPYIR